MSVRSLSRGVHLAVIFLPVAAGLLWFGPKMAATLAAAPPLIFAAAAVYLAAHLARALRLAILASTLLGLSARSGALLHMVTGPGALLLPFKLGELLRLHQLWYLGRSLPGAILVIVLERSFDGVMLIGLLVLLYGLSPDMASGLSILFATTLLAILAALIVVILGPRALRSLQQYIVTHHHRHQSLQNLGRIDLLRRMTTEAAALLKHHGAALLVLSLLIWGLEVLAAVMVVAGLNGDRALTDGIAMLTQRLLGAAQSGEVWSALGLATLLIVWPVAVWLYLPRVKFEPLRVKPPSS